jgi:HD-like signal output (HDOD) protein/CheY-like chemotaxis protein
MSADARLRRVLFVDDEPKVLAALQRMLRPMRHEWEMQFVGSGAEALTSLAQSPFDVLVSDMRMPVMDGASLLDQVSTTHPGVARIVLSGQADREAIMRVAGPAHQYLSKPCDADTLKARLRQAFILRDILATSSLKSLVSRLRSLPSVPEVYLELQKETASPNASIRRIGELVERDAGTTAKMLQLANSAYFGVRETVTSASQAVQLLGLDLVRTLLLSTQLFSQLDPAAMRRFRVPAIWRRSLLMSRGVRALARLERLDECTTGHAITAAMLHDAGRLILASCLPDEYARISDHAYSLGVPLHHVEQEELGCTHADVGAYLFVLWGLPDAVTSAVAWHHNPAASGISGLTPLTLVHVADAVIGGVEHDRSGSGPLDAAYIDTITRRATFAEWKTALVDVCLGDEGEDSK